MRPISRSLSFAGIALGAALIAAACSSAAATPVPAVAGSTPGPSAAGATSVTLASTTDPTLGAYLTGQNGMTLYVLTKDTADTSSCSGTCATTWPPLSAVTGAMITGPTGATGAFATITRSDGLVQVTYNHMPLYYFSGDSASGDTTGQGKNGVWFVAPVSGSVPSGAAPSTAASAAPSTAASAAPSAAASAAPSTAASVAGY
jgi:predicted lipoprotein with Yx(FWY)xxD motif